MVTDRIIIASNKKTSLELTASPYSVKDITGFDRIEVQNVTSQGFDQDGASLVNSYVLPRDMGITGQIRANNTEQMQRLRNKLINMFLPKENIVITHFYGGESKEITVRVEATPKFTFTKVSVMQNYEIQMTAVSPYWRATTESLVQIADVIGCFCFPLVIPVDEGVVFGVKQASLIANVHNASPIKVGMRFCFIANGTVVNPQLFNVRTRQYFKLLCTMTPGEQITVQTGQDKTVVRNDSGRTKDYIGKVDLAGGGNTFLELDPGDNLLRYMADSGEDMLEVKIYYHNRYTGV